MRALGLLALLLAGCGPATAVIFDGDDPGGDDTGTDTGDTGTTDTGTDTGNPVEPDLSEWQGGRVFEFENILGQPCEDSVDEGGPNVTDDDEYADALEACPDCEELFLVEVAPTSICEDQTGGQGLAVSSPVVRGVEFVGTGTVKVYSLRYSGWQGWQVEELATGTVSGATVTYTYEGNVYGAPFTATGTIDF